ncbi:MAG TPA: aspartate carbamoyltransferase catalytic subunit [Planctomycetes bacterium]|nr:aspartate carbamoyltransferase catalytic subunit [Planctomycetota bacterium]
MTKRDLVSIDDLSNQEILALFEHADRFDQDLKAWADQCPGTILATLFFEPSTRTRLSFESAMLRLGGGVISATQGKDTSASKGESLADTARVVGGRYADLIVLRHSDEGAARVVAQFAEVPVINAGDGAHEHPTQTLCDLYTLWKEKGRLHDLEVVLCGDLKYSRTVHSFAFALARFGAKLVFVPFPGMEIPKHVLDRLQRKWKVRVDRGSLEDFRELAPGRDVVYVTPAKPHQQSLFTDSTPFEGADEIARELEEGPKRIDAIYMTRSQRERHGDELSEPGELPSLKPEHLKKAKFKDTSVMHPLPRVSELSYELDRDPRAKYFRQAALGVSIRMALIAFLLGKLDLGGAAPPPPPPEIYRSSEGLRCANPACVSNREGRRYLRPEFFLVEQRPPLLRCVFCSWEKTPLIVGHLESKKLHPANGAEAARIHLKNRVYFESMEEARKAGFGEV